MNEINANLVKELRESTGAGMMNCKKALSESNGDIEKAKEWLRKQGLSSANKKMDRTTSEGVIAIASNANTATLIELNSETDFVAKNEKFISLANAIAEAGLANDSADIESLQDCKITGSNATVNDAIVESIATLGENIRLTRIGSVSIMNGVIEYYIHNAIPGSTTCGKIGVVVAMETPSTVVDVAKLRTTAKQIAMHIAAAKPEALNVESLHPARLQKEKEILSETARQSGKPENVIEKMIEGRIRKFYEEVILMEQFFIMQPDQKISHVLEALSKDIGNEVKLSGYIRFSVGEV